MDIRRSKTECNPSDVGYEESRLDTVNRFFERMINDKIINGVSYRLARRGKVFAAAALGSRHYTDSNLLMESDTIFRIASQTKMFVSIAIQMLVEDGLLSVEDKVAKYIPQFDGAPYNEISIFHLLTHTSGLYHEGIIEDKHHISSWEHISRQNEIDGANTDWIAAALSAGMRRNPGEEWQYSSIGYAILCAIVEKVTDTGSKEFIINRICKPLGMNATTFDPSLEELRNRVIFDEESEDEIKDLASGNKRENGVWDVMPGASLFSNTNDLLRFGLMLSQWGRLDGVRILGRKTVETLSTQRLFNVPNYCWGANDTDRKYGLGVDMRHIPGSLISPGTYFHEGAGHSVLIVDPVEEMVCSCVYPWVNNEWNADCNNRLYNVMWSGVI